MVASFDFKTLIQEVEEFRGTSFPIIIDAKLRDRYYINGPCIIGK